MWRTYTAPWRHWGKLVGWIFPKNSSTLVALGRFLSSVKMANREQKNVEHDEGNPVNWGKEELDSWLQLHWPQLGIKPQLGPGGFRATHLYEKLGLNFFGNQY